MVDIYPSVYDWYSFFIYTEKDVCVTKFPFIQKVFIKHGFTTIQNCYILVPIKIIC